MGENARRTWVETVGQWVNTSETRGETSDRWLKTHQEHGLDVSVCETRPEMHDMGGACWVVVQTHQLEGQSVGKALQCVARVLGSKASWMKWGANDGCLKRKRKREGFPMETHASWLC